MTRCRKNLFQRLRPKPSKPTFLQRFVAGAAWVSVLLLWACAASVYVSPAWCRYVGLIGLAFPFFLGGTVFMLAVSLLFAPRQAWISIAGLVCCMGSIRTYCPFNFSADAPEGSLKLMSYNVMGWCGGNDSVENLNLTALYMRHSGADIVCFQEGFATKEAYENNIRPVFKKAGLQFDSVQLGENVLGCLSHFPIVKKEIICQHEVNGAAAFKLLPREGDTLLVVNCHLESMHLSAKERTEYSDMVHRRDTSSPDSTSRLLASKISVSTADRAKQADKVAAYVARYKGRMPVIVCGDFNDTPISYSRYTVGKGLTDAYRATANGIGRSFNRDAIYVRIDHIFCNAFWKPYECHVDKTPTGSDHYPIVCQLERIK